LNNVIENEKKQKEYIEIEAESLRSSFEQYKKECQSRLEESESMLRKSQIHNLESSKRHNDAIDALQKNSNDEILRVQKECERFERLYSSCQELVSQTSGEAKTSIAALELRLTETLNKLEVASAGARDRDQQLEDIRRAHEVEMAEAKAKLDEALNKLEVASAGARDRDQQLEDIRRAHEVEMAEAKAKLDEALNKLEVASAGARDRDQQLEDIRQVYEGEKTAIKSSLDEALMKLKHSSITVNNQGEEIADVSRKMKLMDATIKSQAEEIAAKTGLIEEKTSLLLEVENKALKEKAELKRGLIQKYTDIGQEREKEIHSLTSSNETLREKLRLLGLSDLQTKDDLNKAEEEIENMRRKLEEATDHDSSPQNEISHLKQQNKDLSVNMQAQIDKLVVQIDSILETQTRAWDREKLELILQKEDAVNKFATKSEEVLLLKSEAKKLESLFQDQMEESEIRFNELLSLKDERISSFEELIKNITEEGDRKMHLLKSDLEISEKRTYDALRLVDDREVIIESLTNDVEGLRSELKEVEEELHRIETREVSRNEEMDRLRIHINDLQEKARNAKDDRRGKIEALFAKLETVKEEKEALEKQLNDTRAAKDELEESVRRLHAKESSPNEKIQSALEAKDNEIHQLGKHLEQMEYDFENLKREISEREHSYMESLNDWKGKCACLEKSVNEFDRKLNDVSNELEVRAVSISALETDLTESREMNTNLRKELLSAELELTQMEDCKLHPQSHDVGTHIEHHGKHNNSSIEVAQEISCELVNTREKLFELKQQLKLRGILPTVHEAVGSE